MVAQQPLSELWAAQFGSEEFGIDPSLPERGVLNPLVTQFLHHCCGGAEIEQSLVVSSLEQLPQQGFEHAHPVMLEVLGQVGVIARHQGNPFGLRQPDAAKPEHGRIHHVNQIRLEVVDRFGDRRSRQGEFQFRVQR